MLHNIQRISFKNQDSLLARSQENETMAGNPTGGIGALLTGEMSRKVGWGIIWERTGTNVLE